MKRLFGTQSHSQITHKTLCAHVAHMKIWHSPGHRPNHPTSHTPTRAHATNVHDTVSRHFLCSHLRLSSFSRTSLLGELGQICSKGRKMEPGNLLIQRLWQEVHIILVSLAALEIGVEVNLSKNLVGERAEPKLRSRPEAKMMTPWPSANNRIVLHAPE